jgi:hypothetical protein
MYVEEVDAPKMLNNEDYELLKLLLLLPPPFQ